jgi:hypothetical protein
MRLASLFLAAVLLIPSIVLAQHHETGSAPSTPPPSPAHSAAPSSSHPSAPSSSPPHSAAPSSPASHSVAPSAHSPVRDSGPTPSGVNSERTAPPSHEPQSEPQRIIPDEKIAGESRITPAPKIGEKTPEREPEAKPEIKKDEPDWKRRPCENGPCKEPTPKPEPPVSELKRGLPIPVCTKGSCPCPPGQTAGKGGCVPVTPPPASEACPAGQVWNGGSCMPANQCPLGQVWNGATCVPNSARCSAGQVWNGTTCRSDCTLATAGLAGITERLRMARHERDDACRQDPSGTECRQAEASYDLAVSEYRAQAAGIPAECSGTVLDPSAII